MASYPITFCIIILTSSQVFIFNSGIIGNLDLETLNMNIARKHYDLGPNIVDAAFSSYRPVTYIVSKSSLLSSLTLYRVSIVV